MESSVCGRREHPIGRDGRGELRSYFEQLRTGNHDKLRWLQRCFTAACVLLAVQVVAWVLAAV